METVYPLHISVDTDIYCKGEEEITINISWIVMYPSLQFVSLLIKQLVEQLVIKTDLR